MDFFFGLMGDQMPSSQEVHLEPIYVHEVWEEYKQDQVLVFNEYVSVTVFGKLWEACFPHVKIREHKAVGMKCNVCAVLSDLRATFKDIKNREYVRHLHMLHRSTYMGERLAYYNRRNLGEQMQEEYLSLISDGMAQHHCQLPWSANLNAHRTLPHHIQGVLMHGRNLNMYRTFHNVANGANLMIHTLLSSLEQVYIEKKKLPKTLFIQIDGGSENTAKAIFGLCELIIIKKLTQRIVLTRLITGHTHEDIDSKFGILWQKTRGMHICTHKQYKNVIRRAFIGGSTPPVEVFDLLAIPDYAGYILPHMGKFERYAKGEWTQLQFTFTAVPVDAINYPLGVKVQYRAYCEKAVVLIQQSSLHESGLIPVNVDVVTYPIEDAEGGNGLSCLASLPCGPLKPDKFVKDSHVVLKEIVRSITKHFKSKPEVVAEWKEWEANAPKTDDAGEYCSTHPLVIPFANELFGLEVTTKDLENENVQDFVRIEPKEVHRRFTNGVRHGNNKNNATTPFEEYNVETGQAIEKGMVFLSVGVYICLSIYISIYTSVCVSLCLAVCLINCQPA